jgi:uncharacterized protein (TIGR02996 family)
MGDSDESGFWSAIGAAPDDELPLRLFADWLDERGDPRGQCLRWVVAYHIRPAFDRHDTKTWDWWSRTPGDPTHYQVSPRQYVLPPNLFARLRTVGLAPGQAEPTFWRCSRTYVGALQALCDAWRDCVRDGVDPLADDRPPSARPASVEA